MNERIRQLARDSHMVEVVCSQKSVKVNYPKNFEKFAELIVRECAKVAWYHTPDTEELEYSHLIEDKILKHFGVEE